MAYTRFTRDSDVYLYGVGRKEGFRCQACSLAGDVMLPTRSAALEHLAEHRRRGDRVPDHAIEEIQVELAYLGEQADEIFIVEEPFASPSPQRFECRGCELNGWDNVSFDFMAALPQHL